MSDIILCLPYPPYPLNGLEDLRRLVYWNDIKAMCEVIRYNYPDYVPSLNHIFNLEHMSYYNMFIARREFVNDYCAWLFDVLARLEGKISLEGYDTQHKRIYGYLTEVLLNVYIHRHNLRRKYFQLAQLYDKGMLRYMLSCEKKAMQKIPGLRSLFYALHINNVTRKEFSEKRHESMTEFLSGGRKRYGRKVTDASSLMDYFRFLSFPGTKCFETANTIYACADIRDLIHNAIFIVFIPKPRADTLKIPGEIQSIIQEKEASNAGVVVLPRFVPNDETPDSLKDTLIESGCRILDYA